MGMRRILTNTIKAFQIIDLLILSLQNHTGYASITLTVSPSSNVEMNQLVAIQCSFSQAEIAASFFSTRNPSVPFCTLESSGGVCKQSDCARQYNTACPNTTTYRVRYPIPLNWNGESVYCKGLVTGNEESNNVTFNVTASITLTVSPSGPVEVNQRVTIQCSFGKFPIAALFYSTASKDSFCDLASEPSGTNCKPTTCSSTYTAACPNDTTYSVEYPIPRSWNGKGVYCKGILTGDEKSNQVNFNVTASITLTVSPSGPVEVNQTVTIQCSYLSNPGSALFYSRTNPDESFCDLSLDGSRKNCKQTLCALKYTATCLNDKTYSVVYPVPRTWNKKGVYCKGLFTGDEESNQVNFSIIVLVTSLTLTPTQITADAGKQITLTCQTDYCNPAANITWYKSSTSLTTPTTDTTDTDGNGLVRTTSVLQYTGVAEDNGQQVYCRASNKKDHIVESSRYTLNIRFISEVSILPSRILSVVVGQRQILIHCYVKNANPEENIEYRWIKSDGHNNSIVLSSQTYVIQRVSDKDSGRYICTARNSAGNSSAFIDVSVQSTPLAPKVEYVVCKSTFGTVTWSSSYRDYHDDKPQETLQYSETDKAFVNVTYEQLNGTETSIHNQKVTNLKPKTEYAFRMLTSNRFGVTFSNNLSCVTDPERLKEMYQRCDEGKIIGGTLGGFALFLILALCVVILYKCRKGKSTSGKSMEKDQNASYVDQFSKQEVHQYEGISTDSNKETLKTNVYEKLEASSPTEKRAEYMELTDSTYTNKERDKSVEVASDLYSNTK